MKDKLEEILALLRKEFNQRQELIADNQRDIDNNPLTIDTIDTKFELDDLNKELKRRNEGNIEFQRAINKYIEEYLHYSVETSRSISYDEAISLTISGELDFNPRHPFFFDDEFYVEILEKLIEKEDYDKCHLIKRRRDSIK